MSHSHGRWSGHYLALSILAAVAIASTVVMHWTRPLSETHTFRQTQTALTAYYFAEEGIRLFRPQLPLFGAVSPSIPLEFPLSQSVAAVGAKLLPGSSPIAGITAWCRAVSAVHFLLCGLMGYLLLVRLGDREVAVAWILLWLLTPFSLYWGTSAMVESTALFYAMAASLVFVKLLAAMSSSRALWLGLPVLLVLSSLAFLTKVTTMLVFCPSLAIAWFIVLWKGRSDKTQLIRTALIGIIGLLLPLLVGYLWVRWGDAVKSENVIGGVGLMSDRLRQWNFGSLTQRFSVQGWSELVFGVQIKTVLVGVLALAIPFSFAYLKRRWHYALLILPVIVGPLVFTNLYFRHSYYSVAVLPSILLLVAMGGSVISQSLRMRGLPMSAAAVALILIGAGWSVLVVNEHLKPRDRSLLEANYLLFPFTSTSTTLNRERLREYQRVTALTERDDVLLVFGDDWSAETAFYTQRRVIMIPTYPTGGFAEEKLEAIRAEWPVAALYHRTVAEHVPEDARVLYQGPLFTVITPALAGFGE